MLTAFCIASHIFINVENGFILLIYIAVMRRGSRQKNTYVVRVMHLSIGKCLHDLASVYRLAFCGPYMLVKF